MAARAIAGEHRAAARHRIVTEFLVQIADQASLVVRRRGVLPLELALTRFAQVSGACLGGLEKSQDVRQPVFYGTKIRAIASTLTDVERCLTEIALLRIELAQVRQ